MIAIILIGSPLDDVRDDDEPASSRHPGDEQPCLAAGIVGVVHRPFQRVAEHRRGLLEGHPMLTPVRRGLGGLPLEAHPPDDEADGAHRVSSSGFTRTSPVRKDLTG